MHVIVGKLFLEIPSLIDDFILKKEKLHFFSKDIFPNALHDQE